MQKARAGSSGTNGVRGVVYKWMWVVRRRGANATAGQKGDAGEEDKGRERERAQVCVEGGWGQKG